MYTAAFPSREDEAHYAKAPSVVNGYVKERRPSFLFACLPCSINFNRDFQFKNYASAVITANLCTPEQNYVKICFKYYKKDK